MAITYITGIPRSGKSYYAMYLLYNQFIKPKPKPSKFEKLFSIFLPQKKLTKSYDIAYTNINQFDFTKSPKIKPFDYDTFYAHIEILHLMYLDKKTDTELNEYALSVELKNALFVIDEAQNYFSKEDKVLTWWFTYHGHLHQDLILITQNLDLIEKSYFKLAEFFYKAVPPSSRFFSNKFRYVQFNSAKLFQKDKIGDFHVPMIPDIFKMYVSGASNTSKSQVKKYLSYFALLLVILIIAFYYFVAQFDTSKPDTNTTQSPKEQNTTVLPAYDTPHNKQKNKESKTEDSDTIKDELFNIRCVDMLCNYNGIDFPKPLFNKVTKKLSPDFIWFFQNSTLTEYFVMLPKDTFDFLQKPQPKDKKDAKNDTQNSPKTVPLLTSHK